MNERLKKLQNETAKLFSEHQQTAIKDRLTSPSKSTYSQISDEMQTPCSQSASQTMSDFKNPTYNQQQQLLSQSSTWNHQFYKSNSFNNQKIMDAQASGQSNILTKERDLQFLMKMNAPENKATFQKSLADTLRQRRELQERIEQERSMIQQLRRQNMPKEIDQKGTAFRIRPQTPRLNLLNVKQEKPIQKPQPKRPTKMEPLQPINHKFMIQRQESEEVKMKIEEILTGTEERDDLSDSAPTDSTPVESKVTDPTEPDYGDENDDPNMSMNGGAGAAGMLFTNFQEKFLEIIDNEEVDNAIELNEIFLSQHLDVKPEELSRLTKIELRVDTSCHNLQVTGEILCSLEYLRMSDSIIKCFRDMGTSFKFVRFLFLARCELKEVQGIQAFEQLEELYLGYNDIEELFDIGFLEHLSVLDLEGNNIKSLDQLYYLKRCQNLTDVNLKHNPVTKETAYYQRIQDNVPRIQYLDDQEVVDGFFEKKTEEAKKANLALSIKSQIASTQQSKSSEKDQEILEKLYKAGELLEFTRDIMSKWYEEALDSMQPEPEEDDMIIKRIKSMNKEQKAAYSFDNYYDELDAGERIIGSRPSSALSQGFRRTISEGMGGNGNRKPSILEMFRSTNNTFYKGGGRSTAISTSESSLRSVFTKAEGNDNENAVSELISNTDQVITGTPLSLLRRRQSGLKTKPSFGMQSASGAVAAKDIYTLINEFNPDSIKINKDDIRQKLAENSIKASVGTLGMNTAVSNYDSNRAESLGASSSGGGQLSMSNNTSSKISILSQGYLKKQLLNGGSGAGAGPIKAQRIVLKPSDISFTKNLKQQ